MDVLSGAHGYRVVGRVFSFTSVAGLHVQIIHLEIKSLACKPYVCAMSMAPKPALCCKLRAVIMAAVHEASQSTSSYTMVCVRILALVTLKGMNAATFSNAGIALNQNTASNVTSLNNTALSAIDPRFSVVSVKQGHTQLPYSMSGIRLA